MQISKLLHPSSRVASAPLPPQRGSADLFGVRTLQHPSLLGRVRLLKPAQQARRFLLGVRLPNPAQQSTVQVSGGLLGRVRLPNSGQQSTILQRFVGARPSALSSTGIQRLKIIVMAVSPCWGASVCLLQRPRLAAIVHSLATVFSTPELSGRKRPPERIWLCNGLQICL